MVSFVALLALRSDLLSGVWPMPANASVHGMTIDRHLLLNLWTVVALAVVAHLILLAGLALSQRTTFSDRSTVRSVLFEYLPLAAFTVLFGWFAFRAERLWALSRYTGAEPAALQVEAAGMQFAWYFRYPGKDGTFGRVQNDLVDPGAGNPLGVDPKDEHGKDDLVSSELVLPAGRQVDVRLRALDVIHGFAVPEMRLKQNAVPGQTVHLHFTPYKSGTYAILCTQLCGLGHYRMNANLRVLPEAEFRRWLQAREKRGTP